MTVPMLFLGIGTPRSIDRVGAISICSISLTVLTELSVIKEI